MAKQLADAIIPNEYGTDPLGKLRIGSKIATELLGKLLVGVGGWVGGWGCVINPSFISTVTLSAFVISSINQPTQPTYSRLGGPGQPTNQPSPC